VSDVTRPGPNLFIVGAPRCGTTSLHSLLAQHPDAFMSPVKEPHYFAQDINRRYEEHVGRSVPSLYGSLEAYLELFEGAGEAQVRGESSVYYLYSQVAAEEIARFDPKAKILVMLREPVDFLYSLHGRLRSMGDEDRPFAEALELEDARARGEHLPRSVRFPEILRYSWYARYVENLRAYQRLFPPEQVCVLLFEDYRADKERVWNQVLEFLELAPAPLPADEDMNPHQEPRFLGLTVFLRERVHWLLDPAAGSPWRFAWRARRKLYRKLEQLNWRKAARVPLDPQLRARLKERFRPEADAVSELIGRDVSAAWGYGDAAGR
jgi:hypothetical protein